MPAAKKSSGPKKAARKSAKKSTPVAQPVVEPEPVVVAPPEPVVAEQSTSTTETVELTLDEQFKDILTRIQEFRNLAAGLVADVRKLQKNVNKQVRESNK